jgi:hypothetical protein
MNHKLLYPLAAMVLAMFVPQTARGQVATDYQRDEVFRDPAHPRHYTRVLEVYRDGSATVIVGPIVPDTARLYRVLRAGRVLRGSLYADIIAGAFDTATRDVARRQEVDFVDAEVDYRSRISIDFDREWLDLFGVVGWVEVRGQIVSNSQSREIEIGGYAQIGEERRPAPALVLGSIGLRGATELLERNTQSLIDRLDSVALLAPEVRSDTTLGNRLRRNQLVLDTLELSYALGRVKDTSAVQQLARAAEDTVAITRSELERSRTASANAAVARSTQGVLRIHQTGILIPLTSLGDTVYLRILSNAAMSDRPTLKASLAEAQILYSALAAAVIDESATEPSAASPNRFSPSAFFQEIRRLTTLLRFVADVAQRSRYTQVGILKRPSVGNVQFGGAFLESLREGDILLSQIGARPGDIVNLSISLSADADARTDKRTFSVAMRLREFGVKRDVADATLLMYRLSTRDEDIEGRIRAAEARVAVNGQPLTIEIESQANFVPASGASLVWSYYPRRGALSFMTTPVRWLHPGIGITVAFTTFGAQTIAISPPPVSTDPNAPAQPVTTTSSPTSRSLQVAAGPILTLFDGAVLAAYGWNLNVPRQRRWAAVGFSFVELAKRLGI